MIMIINSSARSENSKLRKRSALNADRNAGQNCILLSLPNWRFLAVSGSHDQFYYLLK